VTPAGKRRGGAITPLIAATVTLVIAASCTGRRVETPASVTPIVSSSDQGYVGNEACRPCHGVEFDLHRTSRHALTMRPADLRSLGTTAPPAGPIAQSHYRIDAQQNGALRFERADRPEIGSTLGYALGSGKDAVTFIGDFKPGSLVEFRETYLASLHRWCITPGQEAVADVTLGTVHELGMAQRCVLCHAVKTKPDSTEPARGFCGVGCESCHGPGAEHINAVKAGQTNDLKMPDLSKLGASKLDAVCARCHRSIDDITIDSGNAAGTARFQGYGLELSSCFKHSSDRLSCVTCHDPHTNVRTDNRYYERICLSCHSGPASGHSGPASGHSGPASGHSGPASGHSGPASGHSGPASGGKSCPVNAKSDCIPCHMPGRLIFFNQNIPIVMADHLIMAYPGTESSRTSLRKPLSTRP
jgi:hypothetical protein